MKNLTTRVLIADDHQMLRSGLRLLLEGQAGVAVVGEALDGRTAVAMAAELSPDVVIMDIHMPDLNGVDATRQIAEQGHAKVIALSGYSDRRSISEMLKAGAMAYVPKESAFEELIAALKSVVAGTVYLSPKVAGVVVDDFVRGGAPEAAHGKLSGREREVLQLVSEGKSTKQVAIHLKVSVKTVETHRRNIMAKLEIGSVAELTKYAIREGITSLEL